MNRKVIVPRFVSAGTRSLGLPRDVVVTLWNYVHAGFVQEYELLRDN